MVETIEKLMMREHADIHYLLCGFEVELSEEIATLKEEFNKFKWALEKHFFVEEKVIFSIYSGEENMNNLDTVLKEHKDIILLIKKAEENLNQGHLDIFDIKTIIEAHAAFEDDVLYPKLDEELDENQKELILDRASEIIRE